jgi:hypothetical protein
MSKRKLKIEEFDITEEEFYAYTKELLKLHVEEKDGKVEYELFGMAMSDPVKYKNYRKEVDGEEVDAFCIYQIVPQEITCGKCHIKINTDKHEDCPVCHQSFRDMIIVNRDFNDRCADKKNEMNTRFQEEYNGFLAELKKELGVDPADVM